MKVIIANGDGSNEFAASFQDKLLINRSDVMLLELKIQFFLVNTITAGKMSAKHI